MKRITILYLVSAWFMFMAMFQIFHFVSTGSMYGDGRWTDILLYFLISTEADRKAEQQKKIRRERYGVKL